MKNAELIALLSTLPQDLPVMVQFHFEDDSAWEELTADQVQHWAPTLQAPEVRIG